MTPRPVARLVLLGVLAPLIACGPLRRSQGRAPGPGAAPRGVSFENGAVVLSGMALEDGPGSLLAAMSGKVPNFRVRRTRGDRCPEITLRNHVNFQGVSNPHVYVDGTRSTDTCILESLQSRNVERVEVYPMGFTTRPGYGTHGPGLILVFMRSV